MIAYSVKREINKADNELTKLFLHIEVNNVIQLFEVLETLNCDDCIISFSDSLCVNMNIVAHLRTALKSIILG